MGKELTSEKAREMVLKSWENRRKKAAKGIPYPGGPKMKPTACGKCGWVCASKRQAEGHCDGK